MSDLFLNLYNFFEKRRWLLAVIICSVIAVAAFFASGIKMEEDISKIMPKDEKITKMNLIFQNSKFTDKLIFHLYLNDTTVTDPDKLVGFSENLAEVLKERYQPEYIKDINYKVSDDMMAQVYNTFYENIPLFLDEKDYKDIDLLTGRQHLDSTMVRNYKTLISPASIVMKQFIVKDPVGITFIGLKKLQNLQYEDNYELYNGSIVTKDKKHLVFFIDPAHSGNKTAKNSVFLKGVDAAIDSLQKIEGGKVKAEYFGAMAMSVGNAERIKNDITITVSIAISILVVFISLFFRRAAIVFLIFLPVAIGGLISLAILTFFRPNISAIALGMGSVLLGITIDYSLHIFTHYKSTGSPKAVIKDVTTPLLLSCLITASSFFCLMFVKSEALQDLGLFAAISCINAALIGLIVLPHFLKKKKVEEHKAEDHGSLSFVHKYTSYEFDRNPFIIGAIAVVSIICAYTYQLVEFESDMLKMNYVSDKLFVAQENLNKISSASSKSVYLVSSGKTLNEALASSEKVADQVEKLKEEGIVRKYTSVSKMLISDSLQKEKIKRWNNYWTDEKKALLKKNLLESSAKYKFKPEAFAGFFELLDKQYQPVTMEDLADVRKLFFNDFITESKDLTTVVTLLKVDEEDKKQVYADIHENDNLTIVDKKYLTDKFIEILNRDFSLLEVLSLGLVFFILVVSYGRIELGMIAFVPMCLSWLWTLGLMGMLGIKFNIVNIIISTFILGLGIDYSIFIMSGLLQEYRLGLNNLASYKTSIFLSAFTSIVGIGVLVFAQHPALQSIAFLSIVGMFSVIIISYTVQPLLFRLLITNRTRKGFDPYTAEGLFFTAVAYTYFLLGCLLLNVVGPIVLYVLPAKASKRKLILHYLLMYFSKSMIYIMGNVRKKIINETGENFEKPAVIIANHQSFLDILVTIMLYPKMVMVTNEWVWNSPFFGRVIRSADFYLASSDHEAGLEKLKALVDEGYSIIIFPEGTRAADKKVARFHKGAFLMAERLKLDIIPLLLHGTGDTIAKGDLLLKNGRITMKLLPRISSEDKTYGETYSERAKLIGRYFRGEYQKLRDFEETVNYYKDRLIKNYIYKGPVLEWYMRVKLRLENNYEFFNTIVPKKAVITDLGCGYGFLCNMLGFLSDERKIVGVDYDSEKIEVAENGFAKPASVRFEAADITKYDIQNSDVIILNDVMHYLPEVVQTELLDKCFDKLNPGGMLILRDGDSDYQERHKGTKLTEFFSTRFVKFNKTENPLSYLSGKAIVKQAKDKGLDVEIVDNTKLTSNRIFIIKK
ncbi:MAG: MMPL family transporter [Sporocytophaga sp.]|uniref:trifunctional MMPL family transporter/lysophospholipid acyltransferase/class I SAM-dependent methyltransferase n=1 Tax=Sporocytophaga sp. TaxID=2231183 RepID=UPI001B12EE97|nr:trifunctional MMPL family transporter/lysophospholipid acyltransferase/class I SAM-dependent methyltransferase [Sporocytophaga sp.]MBO9700296.1 MMPL family transporter [Sporocytophaga sp.]